MPKTVYHGSCHCKGIQFQITGALDDVVACHCETCQRLSGSHVCATRTAYSNLSITHDDGLQWYRSSDFAQRGFCKNCGSNMFYRADGGINISIMAGVLDDCDQLELTRHIFVAEKSDYYQLHDELDKFPGAD